MPERKSGNRHFDENEQLIESAAQKVEMVITMIRDGRYDSLTRKEGPCEGKTIVGVYWTMNLYNDVFPVIQEGGNYIMINCSPGDNHVRKRQRVNSENVILLQSF